MESLILHPTNSLNTLNRYDIIENGSVLNSVMRIQNLLKNHPYAITPPKSETGRWQTSYKTSSGKRKNLKASTKEELIKKLINVYTTESYLENMTFFDLFEEWLEYKENITNSPNTIKRHEQHYKKYILNSPLHDMRLKKIEDIFLETFCNSLIKNNNLSRKEWTNLKTIINGMFVYAIRRRYIEENPMDRILISVRFRQVSKKTGKTQTYNTEELKALNEYLDEQYEKTKDSALIAVKLNFLLGLRVAELVALKWDDIDGIHLHIEREEIRNQTTNTYEVEEHTKTYTDRFVILIPRARELLEMLPHDSEYIFVRDGERLRARQIAYVLEKYAERMHTSVKSTHKMRKTYASNLSANNVPLDYIREMLGHANLTTTLSYIYNPLTDEETMNLIAKAL